MKKIIQQRNYLKKNTWEFFSPKDYRGMSDRYFVEIIFKKAQKTYYEYVSFYEKLDKENLNSFIDMKISDIKISKIFSLVTDIKVEFNSLIKELKLEKDFSELISNMEEKSFFIWKECLEKERSLAA